MDRNEARQMIMRTGIRLMAAAAGAMILWAASLQASVYGVYQGGSLIGTISDYDDLTRTASQTYGYANSEANLPAGVGPTLEAGKAHLFLVHNSDGLNFFVVFNRTQNGGTSGNATWSFSLTDNGTTASVKVSDDTGELSGSGTSFSGTWSWLGDYTDGGVIGPLSGAAWSLTITPTSQNITGIAAYGPLETVPLADSTANIVITPIPEPAETVGLVAVGLLGLAGWRRWRR